MAERSGNPPGPAHAARTTHTRTHRRQNQRACCVCDVICNEAVPFRPYCAGVATRTPNVSEYMLVLALCLVETVCELFSAFFANYKSWPQAGQSGSAVQSHRCSPVTLRCASAQPSHVAAVAALCTRAANKGGRAVR